MHYKLLQHDYGQVLWRMVMSQTSITYNRLSPFYLCLFPIRSREEIEMWKEKQRQVKTEEEKTKNSKSVVFDTRTSSLVLRPLAPGAGDIVQEESWNKHKWVISDVCYRELWTDQAEILIRQVLSAGVLVILKSGCSFWKC